MIQTGGMKVAGLRLAALRINKQRWSRHAAPPLGAGIAAPVTARSALPIASGTDATQAFSRRINHGRMHPQGERGDR